MDHGGEWREQVWLCPSRGRPGNIAKLREAWELTGAQAQLLVAVDADDPELPSYLADGPVVTVEPVGLGGIINALAEQVAPHCEFIGFLGDDHRPRTAGWDRLLTAALAGRIGVVYGNDQLQGQVVPTAALISSVLVTTLGYMVPPGLEHLWHDMFWKALGEATTLVYCPQVTMEHCHPTARKAPWDEGYARANSEAAYERDGAVYNQFMADRWPGDRDRLLESLLEDREDQPC